MNIYDTNTMLAALPGLRVPPRFFLQRIFRMKVVSDTAEISFDKLSDNLKLAPLVSPHVAGKIQPAKSFSTDTIKPAYVKPKDRLDPSRMIKRYPGEQVGGQLSPAERAALILADTLTDHSDMIDRRMEVMAAEVLKTGSLTLVGEDYPTVTLDFGRASGNTKVLTGSDRWGQSNISPFDDVEDWMSEVASAVGAAVDIVVMGKDAWKLFAADDKVKDALNTDYRQSSLIDLGFTAGEPGTPQYKGTIGQTEFYVYNDTYLDDDGNTQKLIGDDSVILVATGAAACHQGFGAILDEEAGFQALEKYPKSWLEKDPAGRLVMTQSAPIVFPGRPDGTMHVDTDGGA